MKICASCKQAKDESEFGKNRCRKDGLQLQCRQCVKVIQHRWYLKHQATHYQNVKQRRQEIADSQTEKVLAYLKEHPCVDCGESDPMVLEFDHVTGEKKFEVMQGLSSGYGWQTLLAEIEKCEVRCANCHRRRTSKQRGYRKAIFLGRAE